MDNQSVDNNSRVSLTQIYTNLFASRRNKAMLFMGSLVIAYIVSISRAEDMDISYIFFKLMIFPVGSFFILADWLAPYRTFLASDEIVSFVVGGIIFCFVYIGIMIVGIRSNSLRTSKSLFWIFVFLLLLSIGYSNLHR